MPKTIEQLQPYRAIVILQNSDMLSCPCSDEHHAARFFDHVAMRYGYDNVIATYIDDEKEVY